MSLRKSSRRRNGSKSEVLPKPKARRRCTPAPSRVGLAWISRLTGRRDMLASRRKPRYSWRVLSAPKFTQSETPVSRRQLALLLVLAAVLALFALFPAGTALL